MEEVQLPFLTLYRRPYPSENKLFEEPDVERKIAPKGSLLSATAIKLTGIFISECSPDGINSHRLPTEQSPPILNISANS